MIRPNYEISILVIDDDAQVRAVIVEYLQDIGMTNITEAKSPIFALQLLQRTKTHFDLVLSDWEMPEVTGMTLLKAVRNSPRRKNLKFVMVTSQRSMERFKISKAAQWNVNAYIIKPFRRAVLQEKIWDVMGWSHVQGLGA